MRMLTAKVFMSGNSQAIRLPKELRLNTTEIFIYKSGNSLVITPKMNNWEVFWRGYQVLAVILRLITNYLLTYLERLLINDLKNFS